VQPCQEKIQQFPDSRVVPRKKDWTEEERKGKEEREGKGYHRIIYAAPKLPSPNIRLHHVHVTNGRPEKPTTVATLTELTMEKKNIGELKII
jgi:hypothetical protein